MNVIYAHFEKKGTQIDNISFVSFEKLEQWYWILLTTFLCYIDSLNLQWGNK